MSSLPIPPLERPTRMVALFTARAVTLDEVPRLVDFCSQAYGAETPGASLRVVERIPEQPIFKLEACPGVMLKESELLLRVHRMDEPGADWKAMIEHFGRLDPEIGQLAANSLEGAQSYVVLIGSRLLEQGRIRSFLNAGSLIGSALGALFLDPAAVCVTTDPGEWAEACEQSLGIEGAMASLRQ